MTWAIPAKTFLVGEYVALWGGPAIVLTTSPCFEISLTNQEGLHGIHPESPAGRWWNNQRIQHMGLQWSDPYQGCGGVGASSAQFLGAYYAGIALQEKPFVQSEMLEAYLESAWNGQGRPPSGYDVLAQNMSGCVYINRQNNVCQTYIWPFDDLAFILLHTGKKLATHHHLHDLVLSDGVDVLVRVADCALNAFEQSNSEKLVDAIHAYHQQLLAMDLVATHSKHAVELLQRQEGVLAVKGCGALGADVLLVLVSAQALSQQVERLASFGWSLIATSQELYQCKSGVSPSVKHCGE